MKRTLVFTATAFLLIMLALQGCFIVKRAALKNCEYRLTGTSIKEIALSYLRLGITVDVTNPNPVEVVLDRMRFDFYVNDKKIGNGISNLKTSIPSGESRKIEPIVTIDYKKAGAALISLIKSGAAAYKLVGTVYFDSPLGTISFPVIILER